jgi:AcrR family transcriptional regulator
MPQRNVSRHTPDDWSAAALAALGEGGLVAIAVEPIAARLGATKGSFYWHFANREALVEAALLRWEAEHTDAVMRRVESEPDPERQLALLLGAVIAATADDPVELAVLGAADHPIVAPVVERVTRRRMAFTVGLFRALGFTPAQARDRGLLAFSAYVGHAQLARATPGVVPSTSRARARYVDRVIQILTAR